MLPINAITIPDIIMPNNSNESLSLRRRIPIPPKLNNNKINQTFQQQPVQQHQTINFRSKTLKSQQKNDSLTVSLYSLIILKLI